MFSRREERGIAVFPFSLSIATGVIGNQSNHTIPGVVTFFLVKL